MINDPSAVLFAAQIRAAANAQLTAYYTNKTLVNAWNGRGISALITNTSDIVTDGAPTNGFPIMTGVQATNIIVRAQENVADMEAGSNSKLNTLLQVAGDGRSVI